VDHIKIIRLKRKWKLFACFIRKKKLSLKSVVSSVFPAKISRDGQCKESREKKEEAERDSIHRFKIQFIIGSFKITNKVTR
jgi:hypothetical protein